MKARSTHDVSNTLCHQRKKLISSTLWKSHCFLLSLASVQTSLGWRQVIDLFTNKAEGPGRFKEYQIHRWQSRVNISNLHLQKRTFEPVTSGKFKSWPILCYLADINQPCGPHLFQSLCTTNTLSVSS